MKNFLEAKSELQKIISAVVEDLYKEKEIKLESPSDLSHGDFTTNVALQLAAEFKENPREVADKIADKIELPDFISKIEVAGPGFINFTLNDPYLVKLIKNNQETLKVNTENKKIIVEYSQPNIAKPLMVHHLLSTIIGQALSNILEEVGNKVTRINYVGDWGTQFGKLIYAYREWGSEEVVKANPIPELLKLYVEFHNKAEEDDTLEDKGREEFRKLEEGDEENRKLWEWVVKISREEIDKVYEKLGGVHFDSYDAEAFIVPQLPELLEEGKKAGIITEGEGGAFVINLDDEELVPYLVQKSDGATLYSTRDLATIKYRMNELKVDEVLYVVDVAQKLHFEQAFASAKKFDWYQDSTKLTHLAFGRMSFKDRKMSTRKGNVIELEDVVDEAIERAVKIIEEKNPDLPNREQVARIVGIGAVKYSVLSQAPETNLVFDWDKILSFEGNSAPYLQYSHARACSILKKGDFTEAELSNLPEDYNLAPAEALVVRKLGLFGETVSFASLHRKPNIIATYLYELAQVYSSFYANCPVLTAEDDQSKQIRLAIVHNFAQAMKKGLNLLAGIEAPEEM